MSGRALAALLGATLALGGWLAALDPPGGMIGFELAGSAARASAQIGSWPPEWRERVALALGLDFAFLLLYPAALSATCARLARGPLTRVGSACARWVWLAAPLDAIENLALLHQLGRGAGDPAARLALACAIPKFALVAAALGFVATALVLRLVRSLRQRRSMRTPEISLEDWSAALADEIEDRLYGFNVRATGIADGRGLALVARDESRRVVAAALGSTWGGVCELKQVWVDEPLRGEGLGRSLLQRAMSEAEARGCARLLLATHAFQAPGFYEKLGFRELHRLDDYPRGHAEIWMVRELTPRS